MKKSFLNKNCMRKNTMTKFVKTLVFGVVGGYHDWPRDVKFSPQMTVKYTSCETVSALLWLPSEPSLWPHGSTCVSCSSRRCLKSPPLINRWNQVIQSRHTSKLDTQIEESESAKHFFCSGESLLHHIHIIKISGCPIDSPAVLWAFDRHGTMHFLPELAKEKGSRTEALTPH